MVHYACRANKTARGKLEEFVDDYRYSLIAVFLMLAIAFLILASALR